MPKLKININTHNLMLSHQHGRHRKELIVWHETVSPDIAGLADVTANVNYLANIGYGLFGCVDRQGYMGVAPGLAEAVFYVQGGENERGIGIELVSPIPGLLKEKVITVAEAAAMWKTRTIQLKRAAQLAACLSRVHDIPLKYRADCDAGKGVTSHWNVSQKHYASEGHTDCWPLQEGGYFPINYIIWHARYYKSIGFNF